MWEAELGDAGEKKCAMSPVSLLGGETVISTFIFRVPHLFPPFFRFTVFTAIDCFKHNPASPFTVHDKADLD